MAESARPEREPVAESAQPEHDSTAESSRPEREPRDAVVAPASLADVFARAAALGTAAFVRAAEIATAVGQRSGPPRSRRLSQSPDAEPLRARGPASLRRAVALERLPRSVGVLRSFVAAWEARATGPLGRLTGLRALDESWYQRIERPFVPLVDGDEPPNTTSWSPAVERRQFVMPDPPPSFDGPESLLPAWQRRGNDDSPPPAPAIPFTTGPRPGLPGGRPRPPAERRPDGLPTTDRRPTFDPVDTPRPDRPGSSAAALFARNAAAPRARGDAGASSTGGAPGAWPAGGDAGASSTGGDPGAWPAGRDAGASSAGGNAGASRGAHDAGASSAGGNAGASRGAPDAGASFAGGDDGASPGGRDAGTSFAGGDDGASPGGRDAGTSFAGGDGGASPDGGDTGASSAGADAASSSAQRDAGVWSASRDDRASPAGGDAGASQGAPDAGASSAGGDDGASPAGGNAGASNIGRAPGAWSARGEASASSGNASASPGARDAGASSAERNAGVWSAGRIADESGGPGLRAAARGRLPWAARSLALELTRHRSLVRPPGAPGSAFPASTPLAARHITIGAPPTDAASTGAENLQLRLATRAGRALAAALLRPLALLATGPAPTHGSDATPALHTSAERLAGARGAARLAPASAAAPTLPARTHAPLTPVDRPRCAGVPERLDLATPLAPVEPFSPRASALPLAALHARLTNAGSRVLARRIRDVPSMAESPMLGRGAAIASTPLDASRVAALLGGANAAIRPLLGTSSRVRPLDDGHPRHADRAGAADDTQARHADRHIAADDAQARHGDRTLAAEEAPARHGDRDLADRALARRTGGAAQRSSFPHREARWWEPLAVASAFPPFVPAARRLTPRRWLASSTAQALRAESSWRLDPSSLDGTRTERSASLPEVRTATRWANMSAVAARPGAQHLVGSFRSRAKRLSRPEPASPARTSFLTAADPNWVTGHGAPQPAAAFHAQMRGKFVTAETLPRVLRRMRGAEPVVDPRRADGGAGRVTTAFAGRFSQFIPARVIQQARTLDSASPMRSAEHSRTLRRRPAGTNDMRVAAALESRQSADLRHTALAEGRDKGSALLDEPARSVASVARSRLSLAVPQRTRVIPAALSEGPPALALHNARVADPSSILLRMTGALVTAARNQAAAGGTRGPNAATQTLPQVRSGPGNPSLRVLSMTGAFVRTDRNQAVPGGARGPNSATPALRRVGSGVWNPSSFVLGMTGASFTSATNPAAPGGSRGPDRRLQRPLYGRSGAVNPSSRVLRMTGASSALAMNPAAAAGGSRGPDRTMQPLLLGTSRGAGAFRIVASGATRPGGAGGSRGTEPSTRLLLRGTSGAESPLSFQTAASRGADPTQADRVGGSKSARHSLLLGRFAAAGPQGRLVTMTKAAVSFATNLRATIGGRGAEPGAALRRDSDPDGARGRHRLEAVERGPGTGGSGALEFLSRISSARNLERAEDSFVPGTTEPHHMREAAQKARLQFATPRHAGPWAVEAAQPYGLGADSRFGFQAASAVPQAGGQRYGLGTPGPGRALPEAEGQRHGLGAPGAVQDTRRLADRHQARPGATWLHGRPSLVVAVGQLHGRARAAGWPLVGRAPVFGSRAGISRAGSSTRTPMARVPLATRAPAGSLSGGSPRQGARSELASGTATSGGEPQAPPTKTTSGRGVAMPLATAPSPGTRTRSAGERAPALTSTATRPQEPAGVPMTVARPERTPAENAASAADSARAVLGPSTTRWHTAPSSTLVTAANPERPKVPDLDRMALQVYGLIKRRLATERERAGGSGAPRRAW